METTPHVRSDVLVGARSSTSPSSHSATLEHTRSLVVVPAVDWNATPRGHSDHEKHNACPSSAAKYPLSHGVHASAPGAAAMKPARHCWHSRSDDGVGPRASSSPAIHVDTGLQVPSSAYSSGTAHAWQTRSVVDDGASASIAPAAHALWLRHVMAFVAGEKVLVGQTSHSRSDDNVKRVRTCVPGPHCVKFRHARPLVSVTGRTSYCAMSHSGDTRQSVRPANG